MAKRNCLFLAMVIVLAASSSVYGQDWVSRLDLSLGENSRKISLLTFDIKNSNIPSYQASRAMDGFFSGLNTHGSYRINLSRVYEGMRGGVALPVLTGGTLLAFVGVPCTIDEYRLTVNIEIRDLNGNLVQTVAKNENYTIGKNIYTLDSITQIEMNKISKIFSGLIRQARNALNYEATAINNRLTSAAQPFNKNFDELSANLRSGAKVAILPISGSNTAENNRVLGELTRYFVNSGKKYIVVNREYIDKVVAEIALQRSLFVDQNTAVQVGKFVGAQVIIVGRVDITSNSKQFVVHAIDVATGQTVGISVAAY